MCTHCCHRSVAVRSHKKRSNSDQLTVAAEAAAVCTWCRNGMVTRSAVAIVDGEALPRGVAVDGDPVVAAGIAYAVGAYEEVDMLSNAVVDALMVVVVGVAGASDVA